MTLLCSLKSTTFWTATSSISLPPITSGLVGYYPASSFTGTAWNDVSGNGNHAVAIKGAPGVQTQAANVAGNALSIQTVYGSPSDGIQWPTAILPSTYTLFHVSRRITSTGRIFTGVLNNWLSGFWNAYTAQAYHDGWLTGQFNPFGTNWFISTDQNSSYRANSGIYSTSAGGATSAQLSILYGGFDNESCSWAVAEIIVYNRTLSSTEIKLVETYLGSKYLTNTAVWADPYYSSVGLLLLGENTLDSSMLPKPCTVTGSPSISTTRKYGSTSFYFPGGQSWLQYPASDDFNFGTGNFTIEFWLNLNAISGTWSGGYITTWHIGGANSGNGWSIGSSGNSTFDIAFGGMWDASTNYGMTAINLVPYANTWVHYAVVRSGATMTQYLNGAAQNTYNMGTQPIYYPNTEVWVGGWGSGYNGITGYMDEIRITKGVARYNGTFTPTQIT